MTGTNIENGFKAIGGEIRDFYSKNKTHIFTGLSIGGTVATCVLSVKAGAKSARRIDEKERELGRHLTRAEKRKLCWKDMVLPVGSCVLASVSSLGTDVIATRDIARSNALFIASEKAYEKLSEKTKEVLGEKKAKQVKDEMVKEEIIEKQIPLTQVSFDDAPRTGTGTLYPFLDGYSGLRFWSTVDYIDCCVLKLNNYMRDLAPRGDEYDYEDKIVGVPYREWLGYLGFKDNVIKTPERKNKGWNKGFHKDGSDDDPIEYYRTTVELEPGFAVTVINWEKEPTDMKLGRLIKGSGL